DDIPENSKNKSKLLDPDEYLKDNMEEDLKDFYHFVSNIKFTPKEKNNSRIILAINNIFTQNDDFKGVSVCCVNLTCSVIVYFAMSDVAATAIHVTIPDLKIDSFCDFTQYKTNMQFNKRTIHVTDILLQIKPANIKQIFAKYGTVIDFRITPICPK
ncbi:578_t:CDS:2, partial [Funneliformis geosporum]